jgi:hypothetical protein
VNWCFSATNLPPPLVVFLKLLVNAVGFQGHHECLSRHFQPQPHLLFTFSTQKVLYSTVLQYIPHFDQHISFPISSAACRYVRNFTSTFRVSSDGVSYTVQYPLHLKNSRNTVCIPGTSSIAEVKCLFPYCTPYYSER